MTQAEKKIDRFEVDKPKFAVVDLVEKKIVRSVDIPKEASAFGGRGQFKVSPDGKYLFFTKGTSEKDCNFYWVRFDTLLKKLKPALQ